ASQESPTSHGPSSPCWARWTSSTDSALSRSAAASLLRIALTGDGDGLGEGVGEEGGSPWVAVVAGDGVGAGAGACASAPTAKAMSAHDRTHGARREVTAAVYFSRRLTSAARRSLASTRVPSLRRSTSTPSSPPYDSMASTLTS